MPELDEEVKDPADSGDDEVITPDNIDKINDAEDGEEADNEKETQGRDLPAEDKPDGEKTEEEADDSEEASEEEEEESEEEAGDEAEKEKKPDGEAAAAATADEDGNDNKQPKGVPGETMREKALRLEVERVKRINRELKGKKLLGDVKFQAARAPELSDEDKKALEAYDPEQLGNLEKAFTVLAKKHGYVREEALTQKQLVKELNDGFQGWLKDNPEFDEEKDPDGVAFKALDNKYKEYLLYHNPPQGKDHLVKVLNGIKNEYFGITTTPKQTPGQIKAKQEKVKTASHGSTSANPNRLSDRRKAVPATSELSKIARSGGLKGFTEEDLAEMGL